MQVNILKACTLSRYKFGVFVALTAATMIAGCESNVSSVVDGKVIRTKRASLEGFVWYVPGIDCFSEPGPTDVLIDMSNIKDEDREQMEADIEKHNSSLDKKTIEDSCGHA